MTDTRIIPTCKAPDPNTHTPRFRAPPGACDAHCHIFGPGDRYPYAADRTYTPPDAPLSRFKELQSILGLERAVLVNASCHGVDNTVIVDAIAQSGGKYRGVANADDSFTERDFETLNAHGFTEEDAWDIAAISAFFSLSNRLANVMNMRPNAEFYTLGR